MRKSRRRKDKELEMRKFKGKEKDNKK